MNRQKNRRKERTGRRLSAAGLAMLLAISGCRPVLAEEASATYEQYVSGAQRETGDTAQYEIIRISEVEQLLELAENCAYDVWSRDKRVLLEADLDLNGVELMIPVFGGIFDGQGHVIRGLEIRQEGSQMGLFRYLQQGAVIQNLTVEEAKVLPQGSGCQTGILVGRCYGSIVSCQVSGVLEGEEEIGGVVGVNEESGEIRNCTAEVTVVGNRRTGGIAGSNHGTINNCTNRGSINIYTNEMIYDLEDFTVENLEEASSSTQLDAHMDTGGIAGFSDGKIYYSTNAGTVGYAHVGYNTGGVVGRLHQGYIQNCTNTGHVLGRKDVGGIAGQMEPFMEIEYIDGKLDELDREMDIFLDMLESSREHLSGYGDQATDIARELNTHLRNVTTATTNLLDITNDLWQVYNQELSGISSDFERLSDDLENISGWEAPDEDEIKDRLDGAELPSEDEIKDRLDQAELPSEDEIRDRLDQAELPSEDEIKDRLDEAELPSEDEIKDRLDGIDPPGEDSPEEDEEPTGSVSGNDWEKPEKAEDYRNALSDFADSTGNHLHKITDTTSQQNGQVSHNLEIFNKEMKAAMDRLSELADTLEAAQTVTDADGEALIDQARKLRKLISEIRDDLFGYEGITIQDTSDEAPSENIENTGSGEQDDELLRTGDTVTEKWYDTASFQQGKITLCLNRGLVEADSNVGGIVGLIATEHDLDPEDDIVLSGPESLTVQESVRAVVRESRNEGQILAKKNYVGGVAGKADFGAIISCESYADIQSTGGSYVGGIAGSSEDTIRSCFSTGFLKGESYVGGIAGMGTEIYYCDAMNTLQADGEKLGAIAGGLQEEGSLYDNYYVAGGAAGVDSIGYEGGAIPLSYEAFVTREGLPEEFQLLTLRFVTLDDEDEIEEEIAVMQVPYGSSLEEDQLPQLPEKEGCYGSWPRIDYSCITESQVLAAEYTKWVTALEYWNPDQIEDQAVLLVEGEFCPEDELQVTEEENLYEVQIHTADGLYDRPVSVRLHQSLLPKHYEIRLQQEGEDVTIEAGTMGSYVVFAMERPGSFRIVSVSPEIPVAYWILGGAVLLIVLILIIRRLQRRRRAKGKSGQEAQRVEPSQSPEQAKQPQSTEPGFSQVPQETEPEPPKGQQ